MMDFKKFSAFILLAGVALFLYGLFVMITNQPITTTPDTGNVFKDINQSIENIGNNFHRELQREDAKKKMLIGSIILFVGIAVRMSVKGQAKELIETANKQANPTNSMNPKKIRNLTIINSLIFISGFSAVFISLGALSSTIGRVLFEYQNWIRIIGGILIIIFGLLIAGFLKFGFLMRDVRIHMKGRPTGYAGTFIIGMTFAAGWTPCIGPILGQILIFASTQGSTGYGFELLAVYSLGLAVPFFVASLAINSFLSYSKKVQKYMRVIMIISGVLMILFGIMLIANRIRELSQFLPDFGPDFKGEKLFKAFPFVGAFVGGIISFLSPCVLPLIPSYVSFITGISFEDLTGSASREN